MRSRVKISSPHISSNTPILLSITASRSPEVLQYAFKNRFFINSKSSISIARSFNTSNKVYASLSFPVTITQNRKFSIISFINRNISRAFCNGFPDNCNNLIITLNSYLIAFVYCKMLASILSFSPII